MPSIYDDYETEKLYEKMNKPNTLLMKVILMI